MKNRKKTKYQYHLESYIYIDIVAFTKTADECFEKLCKTSRTIKETLIDSDYVLDKIYFVYDRPDRKIPSYAKNIHYIIQGENYVYPQVLDFNLFPKYMRKLKIVPDDMCFSDEMEFENVKPDFKILKLCHDVTMSSFANLKVEHLVLHHYENRDDYNFFEELSPTITKITLYFDYYVYHRLYNNFPDLFLTERYECTSAIRLLRKIPIFVQDLTICVNLSSTYTERSNLKNTNLPFIPLHVKKLTIKYKKYTTSGLFKLDKVKTFSNDGKNWIENKK